MGKLIRGSTEALMLELGMLENPFQLDYTIFHPLATNMDKNIVAIPTPTQHLN